MGWSLPKRLAILKKPFESAGESEEIEPEREVPRLVGQSGRTRSVGVSVVAAPPRLACGVASSPSDEIAPGSIVNLITIDIPAELARFHEVDRIHQ